MKKAIITALAAMTFCSLAQAQEQGYLTGSFETNDHYYFDDEKTGAIAGDDRFGSNNYLKLDYYKDRFSAGVQMESYSPVLVGYPSDLRGAALTNYFVRWADDDFSITAGTF